VNLNELTIKQLHEKLANKEITATEVAEKVFQHIEAVEDDIQAFITLNKEATLEKARAIDESGDFSNVLTAIPGAIKDNITTKGIKTTAASKMLANFEDPLFDATVVAKLNETGAFMVGKVNMDEFAMGSSTETSAFKKTTNPWNTDHVPGGSSGGSAAAVAAGQALYSLGSDTGGSIRQPAAFCGVVGMKPTYGLVSRYGLIPFAPSLDQVGPITKTVEDNALVLQAIAGHDTNDGTSAPQALPNYEAALTGDVKGLKIGVPKEFLSDGVDSEVKEAVMAALKVYEDLGATWEEISLPHAPYGDATYYVIAMGEASSTLARFDGIRFGHRSDKAKDMIDVFKQSRAEGFGEEVKRRILVGSTVLSGSYNEEYFQKAQKVRTLIKQDFEQAFEQYDVIIGPATPTAAFEFGAQTDPLTMYMNDMLTVPVNLAGVPAISVPCGFTEKGLPIGLQIIGKHFDESTVYRTAHAFEQKTEHHKSKPKLGGSN